MASEKQIGQRGHHRIDVEYVVLTILADMALTRS